MHIGTSFAAVMAALLVLAGCAAPGGPPALTKVHATGRSTPAEASPPPAAPQADPPPPAPPSPTTAAIPTPSPVAGCPDVLLLGARGSGQPPGLGPGLERLTDLLGQQVGDAVVLGAAVAYDASPVAGALLDPMGFDEAVRAGVDQLLADTAWQARRCPATRIVWAGFSQGALILRAAMDQVPDPDTAGVDAVVLLADPRRAADDPVDRGTAPVHGEDPAAVPSDHVPAAWTPVTTSWCVADDPVCDPAAGRPVAGLLVHAQGYDDPAIVGPAAEAVADLLGPG